MSTEAVDVRDIVAAETQEQTADNLLNPLDWLAGRLFGRNREPHPVKLVGTKSDIPVTAKPVTDSQGIHDDVYVI